MNSERFAGNVAAGAAILGSFEPDTSASIARSGKLTVAALRRQAAVRVEGPPRISRGKAAEHLRRFGHPRGDSRASATQSFPPIHHQPERLERNTGDF